MSKHKKKKHKQSARASAPPPPPDPQLGLPDWLRYRVSPEATRADATIAAITQNTQKALQGQRMLQARAALEEHALPLLGGVMQLMVQQHADIVRWAQNAMLQLMQEQSDANEPVVGIPADHADELCAALEKVMEWLASLPKLLAAADDADARMVIYETAEAHSEALAEVAEAIDDYALEEVEEDDDDEDDDEDDEDDDGDEDEDDDDEPLITPPADEPPLQIVNPDATPLVG